MQKNTYFRYGLIGFILTALCCFTPILVVLLSAIGLSVLVGWLDYILLPLLGVFLIMMGIGIWKKKFA